MKRPLLLFFLSAFFFTNHSVYATQDGTSCSTAFVANTGSSNTTTHTGSGDDVWFIYTPTAANRLITVSSCGLTTVGTTFEIYNSCNPGDLVLPKYTSSTCGNTAPYQSTKTFQVTSTAPVLIKWKNPGSAVSYNWSITDDALPTGATSATAIKPNEGLNTPNYHYGNSVDLWYYFTTNADGIFTISKPNGSSSHYSGVVYAESDLSTPIAGFTQTTGFQSQIRSGEKYYIKFVKTSDNNYDWNLAFQAQTLLGYSCTSPIVASLGNNNVTYYSSNQWFSFAPAINGVMTVSTVGQTTQDTYEEIYDDCNAGSPLYSVDNAGEYVEQSSITMNVIKDKPYLIKWKSDFTTAAYPFTISVRPFYTGNDIISFSLPNQVNSSTINNTTHTIDVVVGSAVNRSSLIATFQLSQGASATVTATPQLSGTTTNDFTNSLVYKVIAEDGSTQDWTINVTNAIALNSAKDIVSYSFTSMDFIVGSSTINSVNHTVQIHALYSIPDITSLVSVFALSSFATASIGSTNQVSGTTANNFTNSLTYTITAQDGTTQNWTVQIIVDPKPLGEGCATPAAVLQGTNVANNIYVDQYYVYTPTEDGFISLGYCSGAAQKTVTVYSDCPTSNVIASKAVSCGDDLKVLVQNGISVHIKWSNIKNESWSFSKGVFSGKDILTFNPASLIGNADINLSNHTVNAVVDRSVNLASLQIDFTLSQGAKLLNGATQIFLNDHIDFTNPVPLTVKAQDGTTQNYVFTVTKRNTGTGNSIINFFLNNQVAPAVIDNINHTVKLGVPAATNLTTLMPNFTVSDYATAKISGVVQVSSQSIVDFTNPVIYKITSESGIDQNWTVTVTPAPVLNIYANMTSFRFNEQTQLPTIDAINRTISVIVNPGTDRSALIATFYMSSGATAKIGTIAQESSTTANNFNSPIVYLITSEDGLTTLDWTVSVTVAKNTAAAISAFTLAGQISSSINTANKTIDIIMPKGSSASGLIGTFTASAGATLKIGTTAQVSGTTANDYTIPVVYTVVAEDGTTTQNWTVSVAIATAIGTINETAINMYPNPTIDGFYINVSDDTTTLSIFDLGGRLVLTQKITGKTYIDVSALQPGIYIVKANGLTEKLVKK